MGASSRVSRDRFPPLAYRRTPWSDAVRSLELTAGKMILVRPRRMATYRDDVRRKEAGRLRERRPSGNEQRIERSVQHERFPPESRVRGPGIPVRRKNRRTSDLFPGAERIGSDEPVPHFQITGRTDVSGKLRTPLDFVRLRATIRPSSRIPEEASARQLRERIPDERRRNTQTKRTFSQSAPNGAGETGIRRF